MADYPIHIKFWRWLSGAEARQRQADFLERLEMISSDIAAGVARINTAAAAIPAAVTKAVAQGVTDATSSFDTNHADDVAALSGAADTLEAAVAAINPAPDGGQLDDAKAADEADKQ